LNLDMTKNDKAALPGRRRARLSLRYLAALAAVWGSIGALFWPAVNFTIYAVLLRYGYRKVARPLLRDRSVQLKQDIGAAAGLLREAEADLEGLNQRLELISSEKEALRLRLRTDGENIAASLITEAERAAKRKREDTERRIRSEFGKVTAEIQREVVHTATASARSRLSRELSQDDDKRLRQEAVRSLL